MAIQATRWRHNPRKTAVLVALFCLMTTTANARSGPFADLAGSWSGGGRIDMVGQPSERIRCRARYEVGVLGSEVRQYLRCASASSRFDVQSDVSAYRGRKVTGTWNESTRNVGGQVNGRFSRGEILARVSGGNFTAELTLATRGDSQHVNIVPQGGEVRDVAVTLHRRNKTGTEG
jgi:hypothetical protein